MTTRAAVSLWTCSKLARVYLMVYREDFLFPFKIARQGQLRKERVTCLFFIQSKCEFSSFAPDSASFLFQSSL